MNAPTHTNGNWHEANQRYLMAAVANVRAALARDDEAAPRVVGKPQVTEPPAREPLEKIAVDLEAPSALEVLCAAFGLSRFERDVVLLCAGVELDAAFAAACREAGHPAPTFGLALAVLPEAHWSALHPSAPLRHWRLIEVRPTVSLTTAPLRLDERVLHYLVGVSYLDERLQGLIEPLSAPDELPPSQRRLAERLAVLWSSQESPAVQLCGGDAAGKRAIVAAASAALGMQAHVLRGAELPAQAIEREALARLWEREAILDGGVLLIDCDATEPAHFPAALAFVENARSLLALSVAEPVRGERRPLPRLEVSNPSAAEQHDLWRAILPADELAADNEALDNALDGVVRQFDLSWQDIRAAALHGRSAAGERSGDTLSDTLSDKLWDACRVQARPRLDDLAQRIEARAGWDDLVLPAAQMRSLHDIAAHVRQRHRVYEQWGFAARGALGLGISALFAGASGTGKTMAAEVLANELRLDLYRIDLSAVVSKYIGETEKNLRRVFDAAEVGGAILLFDEADALFGKRSEVRDSHDRYANIEVSYLLQRMEAYRGLAILTTNMKSALDSAFLRRLRFVLQFPFPDATQRAEIWRCIFPKSTPTEKLQTAQLARLNVAGGNIRNIALHAAFLAADEEVPVRMNHLLRAARAEYSKLEKPLTEAEIGDWSGD